MAVYDIWYIMQYSKNQCQDVRNGHLISYKDLAIKHPYYQTRQCNQANLKPGQESRYCHVEVENENAVFKYN